VFKHESKDFSEGINKSEFNKDNIDFEDLKNKLNTNVYDDKRLTANVINHIRESIGSHVEIQWETGSGTNILIRTKGGKSIVSPSSSLKDRAKRNVKTPQISHNHTSGIPLPHPEDMVNLLDLKIVNSDITGYYGLLNMKNSFRQFNDTKKNSLKKEAKIMYEKLGKKTFDYRARKKLPKNIRDKDRYKYIKENIDNIVEDYNKIFNKYGIKFEYTPYKLKKR